MSDTEKLNPCPFCGNVPDQYTIGARPQRGDHGQEMVRCKTAYCAISGYAISLDKWQKRSSANQNRKPSG